MSYTADVDHDVSTVTLTFAATDPDATTAPASSPHTATLEAAGTDTDVEIVVTAEDGSTTETYTVTVTRAPLPPGVVLMEVDSVTAFSEEMTEGATDTIQVTLAVEPSADSTVEVTIAFTTGLTATPATMNFTSANWDDEQELVLVAANDDDAEPNDADLLFSMNGDAGNGYGDTATADDGRLVDTINVEFIETDTKGVKLSAAAKEVGENQARAYSIVLTSQPVGGNVNIEVSEPPSGVTVAPTQLAFTDGNWATAQDVTITPTQNTDTADYSDFKLGHEVLGGGYTGMDVAELSVQVLDDEAPQVVITTTEVTVDENTEFTYNIGLTQEPSSGETVTVELVYFTGSISASPVSVDLTSSNYLVGVEVTVTAKSVTRDGSAVINHVISVADTDTSEGSETVYDDSMTASAVVIFIKNVPE